MYFKEPCMLSIAKIKAEVLQKTYCVSTMTKKLLFKKSRNEN